MESGACEQSVTKATAITSPLRSRLLDILSAQLRSPPAHILSKIISSIIVFIIIHLLYGFNTDVSANSALFCSYLQVFVARELLSLHSNIGYIVVIDILVFVSDLRGIF